jgi:L,D-transpeptidase ErfK/SrfK
MKCIEKNNDHSGTRRRQRVAAAVAILLTSGLTSVLTAGLTQTARAESFKLAHPGDSVIGSPFYVKARHKDTLVDIGRQNELGYTDMDQANPKIDIWLPGDGTDVLVPTFYVLPNAPRTGLVLNRAEMRVYYYPVGKPNEVQSYPTSVGQEGWNTPLGTFSVTAKVKDPTWTPPASIRAEHASHGDILPAVVPAGPDNPLGPYALRLNVPGYLIHGTNKPWGLGMPVSHGCIRMNNEGIKQLFPQVSEGTSVTIVDQPYKLGWLGDDLYLEVNIDKEEKRQTARSVIPASVANAQGVKIDWQAAEKAVKENTGLPMLVGSRRSSADQLHLENVF